MSNKETNHLKENDNAEQALENNTESPNNETITSVEVVKNTESAQTESAQVDAVNQDEQSDDNHTAEEEPNSDKPHKEDSTGITMSGIYQWASKLKDDLKSEAVDMKHDVSEKAVAMTLSKLVDAVDLELAAFDKSLVVAKSLVANAEERRAKIAAKKEKYQGMIDKLEK